MGDSLKKEVNKNKKSKTILITTTLLIIMILSLVLIKSFLLNKNFKVESRVNNVEKYQREHKDLKVVGWIKVEGTNIDYPVLEDADKIEYEEDGKIQYVWENGEMEKLHRINYIMGHNVMNLSSNPLINDKNHKRFEQLMSFTYYDFIKENKYIQFTLNGKDYIFKIFSVSYPLSYETTSYNGDIYDKDDTKKYLEKISKENIYDFDIEVDENDTILSLITCTRMFGTNDKRSFKVDARLLRSGERTTNYNVSKSSKYKEVEEKMKGVNEKNEKV